MSTPNVPTQARPKRMSALPSAAAITADEDHSGLATTYTAMQHKRLHRNINNTVADMVDPGLGRVDG
jgi:hypothetical protein